MRQFRSILKGEINPVLLREMRQAVRNRFVSVGLMLYVALLTFGPLVFLLAELPDNFRSDTGERIFHIGLYGSFVASALVVAVHSAGRLIAERLHEDLMFTSTLRPRQIVLGKFLSGVVLSLLFYSVTLPFLTLAYELKGVDIRMMLHTFFFSFCLVQTLHALVLAMFAGVHNLFELTARLLACALLVAVLLHFVSFVFRDIVLNSESIPLVGLVLLYSFLFFLLPTGLLLVASCQFASQMSNRMFVPRIVLSCLGIPALGLCLLFSLMGVGHIRGWTLLMFMLLGIYPYAFFSIIATCERSTYGLRLRQLIPSDYFWIRLILFPLFTGDCNAFCWLFLWIVLVSLAVVFNGSVLAPDFAAGIPLFSTILLSFNYSLAAVFLQKLLPHRWVPKELTWLVMLALLLCGVACSFLMPSGDISEAFIFVPNPFWILEAQGTGNEAIYLQFAFSLAWFGLSTALLGIWARRKFTTEFLPIAPPEQRRQQSVGF